MENSSYVDNVRKFRIGRSEKKKKPYLDRSNTKCNTYITLFTRSIFRANQIDIVLLSSKIKFLLYRT